MISMYSIVIIVTFNESVDYTEIYIGIPTVVLLLFAFLSARDAAKAAWEAVNTAKDDQRPWLQIEPIPREGVDVIRNGNGDIDLIKIRFNIEIRNVGSSVAVKIRVRFCFSAIGHYEKFLFSEDDFDLYERNTPPEVIDNVYSLGPGQTIKIFSFYRAYWSDILNATERSKYKYKESGKNIRERNFKPVLSVAARYESLVGHKKEYENKVAFSFYNDIGNGSLPPFNSDEIEKHPFSIRKENIYIINEGSENA